MKLELCLDEKDLREAASDWLKNRHNVTIAPDDLEPVMETETQGEYSETVETYTQVGFRVKPEVINKLFSDLIKGTP